MTDDATRILRDAHDRKVDERDLRPAPAWETVERDRFLELLQREHNTTVLELGARTGSVAAFFKAHGCHVVRVDLSPKHSRTLQSQRAWSQDTGRRNAPQQHLSFAEQIIDGRAHERYRGIAISTPSPLTRHVHIDAR
jgi:SAM-dependent methyltransferase